MQFLKGPNIFLGIIWMCFETIDLCHVKLKQRIDKWVLEITVTLPWQIILKGKRLRHQAKLYSATQALISFKLCDLCQETRR